MNTQATLPSALNFTQLIHAIRQVNDELTAQASRAVNASLTLRNWLIGLYVEEYERQGVDRAEYGDKLMDRLAESLTRHGVSRCDRREIYRYRQFYITYPQIVEAVTPQLQQLVGAAVFPGNNSLSDTVEQHIVETTPQCQIGGQILISRLSFTHFVELLNLEDAAQRTFYEIECIQGNWSVRELKRQIHSFYYQRCGSPDA